MGTGRRSRGSTSLRKANLLILLALDGISLQKSEVLYNKIKMKSSDYLPVHIVILYALDSLSFVNHCFMLS